MRTTSRLLLAVTAVACRDPAASSVRDDVSTPPETLPTGSLRPVELPNLGLIVDAPDGAVASPSDRRPNASAHVAIGAFKLNIDAIDQNSAPSFAKARELPPGTRLVRDLRGERTADGWIDIKEIERDFDKVRQIEVTVRRTIRTTPWDCGAATRSEPMANMVLAACLSLRSDQDDRLAWLRSVVKEPSSKRTRPARPRPAPPRDGSAIAMALRPKMLRVRYCYESALAKDPTLRGTVQLELAITANGVTESVTARGIAEPLERCIEKAVTPLSLPATGKPRTAIYPLKFGG